MTINPGQALEQKASSTAERPDKDSNNNNSRTGSGQTSRRPLLGRRVDQCNAGFSLDHLQEQQAARNSHWFADDSVMMAASSLSECEPSCTCTRSCSTGESATPEIANFEESHNTSNIAADALCSFCMQQQQQQQQQYQQYKQRRKTSMSPKRQQFRAGVDPFVDYLHATSLLSNSCQSTAASDRTLVEQQSNAEKDLELVNLLASSGRRNDTAQMEASSKTPLEGDLRRLQWPSQEQEEPEHRQLHSDQVMRDLQQRLAEAQQELKLQRQLSAQMELDLKRKIDAFQERLQGADVDTALEARQQHQLRHEAGETMRTFSHQNPIAIDEQELRETPDGEPIPDLRDKLDHYRDFVVLHRPSASQKPPLNDAKHGSLRSVSVDRQQERSPANREREQQQLEQPRTRKWQGDRLEERRGSTRARSKEILKRDVKRREQQLEEAMSGTQVSDSIDTYQRTAGKYKVEVTLNACRSGLHSHLDDERRKSSPAREPDVQHRRDSQVPSCQRNTKAASLERHAGKNNYESCDSVVTCGPEATSGERSVDGQISWHEQSARLQEEHELEALREEIRRRLVHEQPRACPNSSPHGRFTSGQVLRDARKLLDEKYVSPGIEVLEGSSESHLLLISTSNSPAQAPRSNTTGLEYQKQSSEGQTTKAMAFSSTNKQQHVVRKSLLELLYDAVQGRQFFEVRSSKERSPEWRSSHLEGQQQCLLCNTHMNPDFAATSSEDHDGYQVEHDENVLARGGKGSQIPASQSRQDAPMYHRRVFKDDARQARSESMRRNLSGSSHSEPAGDLASSNTDTPRRAGRSAATATHRRGGVLRPSTRDRVDHTDVRVGSYQSDQPSSRNPATESSYSHAHEVRGARRTRQLAMNQSRAEGSGRTASRARLRSTTSDTNRADYNRDHRFTYNKQQLQAARTDSRNGGLALAPRPSSVEDSTEASDRDGEVDTGRRVWRERASIDLLCRHNQTSSDSLQESDSPRRRMPLNVTVGSRGGIGVQLPDRRQMQERAAARKDEVKQSNANPQNSPGITGRTKVEIGKPTQVNPEDTLTQEDIEACKTLASDKVEERRNRKAAAAPTKMMTGTMAAAPTASAPTAAAPMPRKVAEREEAAAQPRPARVEDTSQDDGVLALGRKNPSPKQQQQRSRLASDAASLASKSRSKSQRRRNSSGSASLAKQPENPSGTSAATGTICVVTQHCCSSTMCCRQCGAAPRCNTTPAQHQMVAEAACRPC